jgi:phage regulator Rha-like protein
MAFSKRRQDILKAIEDNNVDPKNRAEVDKIVRETRKAKENKKYHMYQY